MWLTKPARGKSHRTTKKTPPERDGRSRWASLHPRGTRQALLRSPDHLWGAVWSTIYDPVARAINRFQARIERMRQAGICSHMPAAEPISSASRRAAYRFGKCKYSGFPCAGCRNAVVHAGAAEFPVFANCARHCSSVMRAGGVCVVPSVMTSK